MTTVKKMIISLPFLWENFSIMLPYRDNDWTHSEIEIKVNDSFETWIFSRSFDQGDHLTIKKKDTEIDLDICISTNTVMFTTSLISYDELKKYIDFCPVKLEGKVGDVDIDCYTYKLTGLFFSSGITHYYKEGTVSASTERFQVLKT